MKGEAPMKKRFWILAALLALAAITGVTAAALCAPRQTSGPPEEPRGGYILTSVEGTVGVLRDGELILRTGLRVESLRAADRALVENGIHSDSFDEILMLLEDLGA